MQELLAIRRTSSVMPAMFGRRASEPMDDRVEAMRNTIRNTLQAIFDGRTQVEQIADSTQQEVRLLEEEYETVRTECLDTIEHVEQIARESRIARQRLVTVNRDVRKYTESEMENAYTEAYDLQIQLGQWQEREIQLRLRRDDIARRLKAMRSTAHQAEVLLVQFGHASRTLDIDFGDLSRTLEDAHMYSVLGLRMLQLQEDERRQLVRQLHDGPMQHLASVSMRMQSNNTQIDSMDDEWKVDIRDRLAEVIGDLRQIVFDLRPPLLDDLGLVPTLRRYLNQWSESVHITASVTLIGLESGLSPTEKIAMFRAVQEALRNVAEHAQASTVEVKLTYGAERLDVLVTDDGTGLEAVNWSDWVESGRLGLMICRQRISVLGGRVEVGALEGGGQGMCVQITLPIDRGGHKSV